MIKLTIKTSIANISGIGQVYKRRLEHLGIKNVQDLLFYFPRRWDDLSKISKISEIKIGDFVTVKGKIQDIKGTFIFKRRHIIEAMVGDETGSVRVIWYNQPYLLDSIFKGDEVILSGKIAKPKSKLALQSPALEKVFPGKELVHMGRIVPVYPEIRGLSSRWLRYKIKSLSSLFKDIKDYLPEAIKESQKVISLSDAITQVHFPENFKKLEEAKKRLAFDELFLMQLSWLQKKQAWEEGEALKIPFDQNLAKKFVSSLPYKLTDAQKKSAWEILRDLEKIKPMNRLLEGDVGSGKTIVAALAILMVQKSGKQSAYMAPTEILAQQHFKTLSETLEKFGVKISLILGSTKTQSKKQIYKKLKQGEIDLIIGTHALIQEKVDFKNLALAIVDEQHRFGVKQRALLRAKGSVNGKFIPHLLTMTATPIPRTLSLSIYGDLDLSMIDEMPKNRQKIITKIIKPGKRDETYEFIRKEAREGKQTFIICPLIDESDKLEVKAAKTEQQRLAKEVFPDLRVGLVHGRMKAEQKERVMNLFQNKKLDILVATTVIEVGIDVPQASVMVVEGAERFGLAQLHQLRGRVGRASHQSYCFLFTEKAGGKAVTRLNALAELSNGFKLAEKDLEIRGPGEVFGRLQHGYLNLKMADLFDTVLIKQAREGASDILRNDSALKNHQELKRELQRFQTIYHLE